MMRLAIACLVALQGCSLLESSSLQIMVMGSGTESHPETGEAIQLNNSLDDFRGLAGLEVELFGLDIPDKITVADLQHRMTRVFDVPTSGTARAVITLLGEDGTAIAQGSGSWLNEDGIEWHLTIRRELIPLHVDILPDGRTDCSRWGCEQEWRFTIREDEQNYPNEMLWVTLSAVVRGACIGICGG